MVIDALGSVLFWIGVAIILWHSPLILRYFYVRIFCKGMSNMRTAPEIGLKMADLIRIDMATKGKSETGYRVIDLGSAWGYLSCDLAGALPTAAFLGVDCDPGGVRFSRALAKRRGLKNVVFEVSDFFKREDIAQFDAIVYYLPDYLMAPMGEFLREKAAPGTLILANRFQLEAGWTPEEVVMVETKFPRQGRLNVYRR